MIEALRPYSEMRRTGLPWLGDVPAHWDVRRNGRLFGARRETGFPDLPILEVSIRSGVRIRDFDNGGRKQEMADRSKYQRAVRGDIAYNMMRMWQGAVGIAPADGLVSPRLCRRPPVPGKPMPGTTPICSAPPLICARSTCSRAASCRIEIGSIGSRSSRCLRSIPPLDEQRLIVRFLDWHGAQTAKLIRAKKKLIALLNEQKQTITHRVITRGLDPNVKLKPSGVPWLGDIPSHYELQRFGRVAHITTGFAFKSEGFSATEEDVRLLRGVNIAPGEIRW